MEIAHWLNSCTERVPDNVQRVYLGHETCIDQVPSLLDMREFSHRLRDSNQELTLVTPFLTEDDLSMTCQLIEDMSESVGLLEVACNDWGLLHWLTETRIAEPTIGRLLVGQTTDPRLASFDLPERQLPYERSIFHADGTTVALRYRRPTDALMKHLRSCSIATPEVLTVLREMGLRRLEISNTLQGVHLTLDAGWNVTLHMPEVPVAIARHCWHDDGNQWLHSTFPVPLYQRDNMVFYCNDDKPPNLHELKIDRLVYKED